MPSPTPRLLLADDHALVAASIGRVLAKTWPDVAVTTTIDGTLEHLRTHPVDLLLLDVDFRERPRTGFDVLRHCIRHHPTVKVVMLTVWADSWIIDAAQRDGAKACFGKGGDPLMLVEVIKMLLAGGEYWDNRKPDEGPPPTDKQMAVFRLVADGLKHGAIADRLGCAEVTVEAHLVQIKKRLQVTSVAQALVKGAEMGLLLKIDPGGSYPTPGGGGGQLASTD